MRRALLLALVLPACSEPWGEAVIECRIAAGGGFERVCQLESRESDRGFEMIVRRPDGGFRRLLGTGASVEAADGAKQPRVIRLADGRLEADFGTDAYRVPPWVPE